VSHSFANPTGNLYITAAQDQMIRGYIPAATSARYSNTTDRDENCGPGFVYGPLL
jgi:hypothetical protein